MHLTYPIDADTLGRDAIRFGPRSRIQDLAPARKRGAKTVQIRAGDIHKALRFAQRSALVCGALGSLIFQEEYKVKLLSRDGPGVGMSTMFTYEV